MFIAIGIGSNTPQAQSNVACAIAWLKTRFAGLCASEIYQTDGVGAKSRGTRYCNAVATGHTDMSAGEITSLLKDYEQANGRVKGNREITIDLDLVVYGAEVLRPTDFAHTYFQRGFRQLASGATQAVSDQV